MIVDKYGRVAGSIDLATLAQMYVQTDDDDLRVHYRQVAIENGSELGEVVVTESEPEPVSGEGGPPPKAGPGSSRDAWATYATTQGLDVTDDMTRDDIIEAVEE